MSVLILARLTRQGPTTEKATGLLIGGGFGTRNIRSGSGPPHAIRVSRSQLVCYREVDRRKRCRQSGREQCGPPRRNSQVTDGSRFPAARNEALQPAERSADDERVRDADCQLRGIPFGPSRVDSSGYPQSPRWTASRVRPNAADSVACYGPVDVIVREHETVGPVLRALDTPATRGFERHDR